MTVGRVEGADIYRTFQVNNNTTSTLGRHTIKFGFDIGYAATRTLERVAAAMGAVLLASLRSLLVDPPLVCAVSAFSCQSARTDRLMQRVGAYSNFSPDLRHAPACIQ